MPYLISYNNLKWKKSKNAYIYIYTHIHTLTYIKLNHFAVHLKLAHHLNQFYFNKKFLKITSGKKTIKKEGIEVCKILFSHPRSRLRLFVYANLLLKFQKKSFGKKKFPCWFCTFVVKLIWWNWNHVFIYILQMGMFIYVPWWYTCIILSTDKS